MAEIIATVPQFGGLLAAVKVVFMLAFIAPWLHFATWASKDATKLFGSATAWSAVVLGAGLLGVMSWLVMPFYILGLLFYVVLAAAGLVAYVVYRNGRVGEKDKVLTKAHLTASLSRRDKFQVEILTKVTIYDANEKVVFPPDMTKAEIDEMETYNLAQELLHDMVWRRASEVALAPAGEKARLLYVIDGVTTERPAMDLADSERAIHFLKGVAGMDVEDRRQPQKGSISIDLNGARSDMEVGSAGTTKGQRMMFRVIQEAVRTELPLLGMPEDLLAEVEKLAKTKNGLFIVSGRRASGVTSTLYSILRQRDAFIQNVVAVEATGALDLENITQHPYHDDAKLPQVLTAVLQRGADVLMVDNCPDGETARLIVKASAKRPVLLGMQAGDSFVALAKWVQLCGNAEAAVAILRAVMCQLLLRRLCVECREPYRPDPQRLAKLNLSAEKIEQFYRPGEPGEGKKGSPVCPACQGSGYRGRTAAFELLMLSKDIRQLITQSATVAQIRAACRKNRMLYLQEQALRKVIDGTTSVQEVIRVTRQDKKT